MITRIDFVTIFQNYIKKYGLEKFKTADNDIIIDARIFNNLYVYLMVSINGRLDTYIPLSMLIDEYVDGINNNIFNIKNAKFYIQFSFKDAYSYLTNLDYNFDFNKPTSSFKSLCGNFIDEEEIEDHEFESDIEYTIIDRLMNEIIINDPRLICKKYNLK